MKLKFFLKSIVIVGIITSVFAEAASRIEQNGFVSALVPRSPHLVDPLDQRRVFSIYLPDGYDEPGVRFPVIYFGPGLGGNNLDFNLSNKIILDDLISRRLMVPTIIVYIDPSVVFGIGADGRRHYQGSWYVDSVLNGAFETYITTQLIPFVDLTYKTKASVGFRAIMGQSMGGFGAILLGTRHPDLFCGFASAGGTTFWVYDTALASPGYPAITFNSIILPEIPTSGPNAGKIDPTNGINTFAAFSYAGAFSPNITGGTPFADQFFVDMPFMVQPDGTAVLSNAQPGGPPYAFGQIGNPCGGRGSSPVSLVLDPTVIARWQLDDPYVIMDSYVATMQKQEIYLDAGDLEPLNNVGARVLSDKYVANAIDHEYILYKGNHVTCLVAPIACSRFRTIFQLFSAKFAQAGIFPDDIRVKIVGNGSIIINNATLSIDAGTMVGIETSPLLGVTATNIAIEIQDNGLLSIGDHLTRGGGLQIGNRYSKARLAGDPALANDTVACSLTVDGNNAHCIVGKQGFLGFGMGIDGQNPTQPNFWSVTGLTNVQDIAITLNKGTFDINQIPEGLNRNSSLLGIGNSASYSFSINPSQAVLRGGSGSVASTDLWGIHPTFIATIGDLLPGGIRSNIDTDPSAIDCIYLQPMGSTLFYTDIINREVLATSGEYNDRGLPDNYAITTSSLQSFLDFLDTQNYRDQVSKEGAITFGADGNMHVSYVNNDHITSVLTDQAPVGTHGFVNFAQIAQTTGTLGVLVAPINSIDELIIVYDLDPP